MLTPDQAKIVRSFILKQLNANPGVELIAYFVGEAAAERMPTFTTVGGPAQWIVDTALEDPEPTIFLQVIARIDNGGLPGEITSLAAELTLDPTRWRRRAFSQAALEETLVVGGGQPFIDRGGFRMLLANHTSQPTSVCTIVHGELGSGKSYLREFCAQIQNRFDGFRVGFTDVSQRSGSALDPLVPADDLAQGLGTSYRRVPRPHEDLHRYASNLATWIADQTPVRSTPAIALLEGFDSEGLPEAMHTFVKDLVAALVTDPRGAARMHVVLLGYAHKRLEDAKLPFTTAVLEHVGQPEIEHWFRKRFPNRPAYEYEDAAAEIAARVFAPGPHRMRTLRALVHAAAEESFREG